MAIVRVARVGGSNDKFHEEFGRCLVAVLFRVDDKTSDLVGMRSQPGLVPPSMSWEWRGREWYRSSYEAALPGRVWAMMETVDTCLKYDKSLSPLKRMEIKFWDKYAAELKLGNFNIDELMKRASRCKKVSPYDISADDLIAPTRMKEKIPLFEALGSDFLAIRREPALEGTSATVSVGAEERTKSDVFDFAVFLLDLLHRSECGALKELEDAEYVGLKRLTHLKWAAFRQEPSARAELHEIGVDLISQPIRSFLQTKGSSRNSQQEVSDLMAFAQLRMEDLPVIDKAATRAIKKWKRKYEVERFFFNRDSLVRREVALMMKRAWDTIEEYIKIYSPKLGRDLGPTPSIRKLRATFRNPNFNLAFDNLYQLYSYLISLHLQYSWRIGDENWFKNSTILRDAESYLLDRINDAEQKYIPPAEEMPVSVLSPADLAAFEKMHLKAAKKKKFGVRLRRLFGKKETGSKNDRSSSFASTAADSESGATTSSRMMTLVEPVMEVFEDGSAPDASKDDQETNQYCVSMFLERVLNGCRTRNTKFPASASLLQAALTRLFFFDTPCVPSAPVSLKNRIVSLLDEVPNDFEVEKLMKDHNWNEILSDPCLVKYRDAATSLHIAYATDDAIMQSSRIQWNKLLLDLKYPTPEYRASNRLFSRFFNWFKSSQPRRLPI